jgi:hypothetical protein
MCFVALSVIDVLRTSGTVPIGLCCFPLQLAGQDVMDGAKTKGVGIVQIMEENTLSGLNKR